MIWKNSNNSTKSLSIERLLRYKIYCFLTYGSIKPNDNYSLNSVSYDLNGNIKTLSRNGLKSNNSFGLIDNLAYTYNSNSNKIQAVTDNSNESASFKDVSGNDYAYSLDGSLTSDANKGITLIEYNYLKKPRRIIQNGVEILYQYDATGKKLKETIGSNVTDYLGNLIFKNGVLYQISHDEGRIINGEYEYNIKDHLGNLRVAFRDSLGVAKITQSNSYGIWGETLPTLSYLKSLWKEDNFRFTGKESLQGTEYIDFGARFYDNIVPRFLSIDPLSELNTRFSPMVYGNANPLRFIDPDGNEAVEAKEDKPKPKPKNVETAQGAYGIPVYTSSTQTQGVVAGYTAGYNNNAQYGGATVNITGFRVEYNNNTGTGAGNLALEGGVKATALQGAMSVKGGTENNNVGVGAEGNVFLAEANATVGILTGENNKKGAFIGGEAGAYALKGEVNPSITAFGYKFGLTFGGSLASAHAGIGVGAYKDENKGTFVVKGMGNLGFGVGAKFGFQVEKTLK